MSTCQEKLSGRIIWQLVKNEYSKPNLKKKNQNSKNNRIRKKSINKPQISNLPSQTTSVRYKTQYLPFKTSSTFAFSSNSDNMIH